MMSTISLPKLSTMWSSGGSHSKTADTAGSPKSGAAEKKGAHTRDSRHHAMSSSNMNASPQRGGSTLPHGVSESHIRRHVSGLPQLQHTPSPVAKKSSSVASSNQHHSDDLSFYPPALKEFISHERREENRGNENLHAHKRAHNCRMWMEYFLFHCDTSQSRISIDLVESMFLDPPLLVSKEALEQLSSHDEPQLFSTGRSGFQLFVKLQQGLRQLGYIRPETWFDTAPITVDDESHPFAIAISYLSFSTMILSTTVSLGRPSWTDEDVHTLFVFLVGSTDKLTLSQHEWSLACQKLRTSSDQRHHLNHVASQMARLQHMLTEDWHVNLREVRKVHHLVKHQELHAKQQQLMQTQQPHAAVAIHKQFLPEAVASAQHAASTATHDIDKLVYWLQLYVQERDFSSTIQQLQHQLEQQMIESPKPNTSTSDLPVSTEELSSKLQQLQGQQDRFDVPPVVTSHQDGKASASSSPHHNNSGLSMLRRSFAKPLAVLSSGFSGKVTFHATASSPLLALPQSRSPSRAGSIFAPAIVEEEPGDSSTCAPAASADNVSPAALESPLQQNDLSPSLSASSSSSFSQPVSQTVVATSSDPQPKSPLRLSTTTSAALATLMTQSTKQPPAFNSSSSTYGQHHHQATRMPLYISLSELETLLGVLMELELYTSKHVHGQ